MLRERLLKRDLSRRDFLRICFIGILGLLFSKQSGVYLDGIFRVDLDGSEKLDFDKLALLSFKFSQALDHIAEIDLKPTDENLGFLVRELYTRYEYEGFGNIRSLPVGVHFTFFENSTKANNQLGESDCATYVNINARTTNPISPRYDDGWEMGVAHELAHMASGDTECKKGDPAWRESSAQIAAIEVCAGLALEGSPYFLRLAIEGIRDMSMAGAFGVAIVDKTLDRYEKLRQLIWPGAVAEAAYQRQLRLMAENIPTELIWAYWVTPMQQIVDSIKQSDPSIDGLAFPPNSFTDVGGIFRRNPNPDRRKLDDTKYLFEHLEELAAG